MNDNGLSMKATLAGLVLAVFAAGCSDAMTPDDYANAWNNSVSDYRKIDKNPDDAAADPQGVADGSQETRMRAADNISNEIRAVADSIKDLKAPAQFAELQQETYLFYRGQADDYSGYSEAIGSGDANKATDAAQRINDFVGEHEQTVSKVINGLGTDSTRFRSSWDQVMKDVGS